MIGAGGASAPGRRAAAAAAGRLPLLRGRRAVTRRRRLGVDGGGPRVGRLGGRGRLVRRHRRGAGPTSVADQLGTALVALSPQPLLLLHRRQPFHVAGVSGAARGEGEASPLRVDVQKLCNMCVL